ncbi:MAG TPA: hypothetical protein VJZ27_18220, partial [Aggregatilineales bacterium]|nr:hypothetical protein [Aggregatilineales bacterium]
MVIRFIVILTLLASVALPVAAQTNNPDNITWDDAPITPQMRHIGDWMVAEGWYEAEDVYGPFGEESFEVGDTAEFGAAIDYFEGAKNTYSLRHKSDRAYFWLPPWYEVDESALMAAGEYFDRTIQPFVRSIFGNEDNPGIDGDPRLHIVHEEYLGYGAVGVFRPEDQCPRTLCPGSNQRDTIYYSLDWGEIGSDEYYTTITHEFQHVIRYTVDCNEHRWMNEGLSQLGEHLSGFAPSYSVGENLNIFLENPDHRLDGWADFTTDPSIYYGSSYLFMVYLYERFGLDFIRVLAASPYDGLAAVYNTLRDMNPDTDLDSVFGDWLIANYLDDPFVEDGRYYYSSLGLPVDVATTAISIPDDAPAIYARSLNQYGAVYFELDPGTYNILFDGDDLTPITGEHPHSGEWMWWAYNAESSLTRLTRTVDLRDVETATLQFSMWYNTEEDYDWIDVMVSVDGGHHWKYLTGDGMIPASDMIPVPHYTGRSERWMDKKLDLSPYAGSEILLRFEYATDGSLSDDVLLLDDIAVPEIGFFDDVENLEASWQADGFIRVRDSVHQNWIVAYAGKGKTPTAERFSLSPEHITQTTITVPQTGGVVV